MSGEWTQELKDKVFNILKVNSRLRTLFSDAEDLHEKQMYSDLIDVTSNTLKSLLIDDDTNTFLFPIPDGTDKISQRIALYMNALHDIYRPKLFAASNMHLLSRKLDNILMMIDRK